MRILITGSSGQIGTNLALRLLQEGHEIFGVDKRVNTWTDKFRYILQDLSCHYPSHAVGIGGGVSQGGPWGASGRPCKGASTHSPAAPCAGECHHDL